MQGLQGLAGLQTLVEDTPEAQPEAIHGGYVDPKHAQWGETAAPYSYQSLQTPTGSASRNIQDPYVDDQDPYYYGLAAGNLGQDPTSERAPWTHAAPYPKDPIGTGSIGPDNNIPRVMQNASIHASRVGGKRNVQSPTMEAEQDDWKEIWEIEPGNVDLSLVPAQIKSGAAPGGRGGTDRTQSFAKQNQYGFDSRHQHRRYAAGSIPGNYMWLKPGGRPLVKSLAGPARPPIGPESPFQGDNLGASFDTHGAILATIPTAYEAPPSPYVAPSSPVDEAPQDVADFYGYGGY